MLEKKNEGGHRGGRRGNVQERRGKTKRRKRKFWGGGSKRSNNSENPKQRKIKLVGSVADFLVKCMDSNGQKQALIPYVT